MLNKWLSKEHRFIGRVMEKGGWSPAIIILQPDLNLHIFLPGLYRNNVDGEIPKLIEGRIGDWDLKVMDGASSVSFTPNSFNYFNEIIKLEEEEKNIFSNSFDNKIWTRVTFTPKTCTFRRIGSFPDIPDEWGITFYPEKNNRTLFSFFSNDRNPHLLRSDIFSIADRSIYFSNNEKWNLEAIRARLKLFMSCLSFFAGGPVSYELLVGKYKKEILAVQFKNESNPNAYICPSPYNAAIGLKENSLSTFFLEFIKKIEEFIKSEQDKVQVLLSYFNLLYMAPFDEVKIALSFQLMEALAKFKGRYLSGAYRNKIIKKMSEKLSGEMCSSCINLLQREIKDESDFLDEYIGKALDAIIIEEAFEVSPTIVKEIAREYRNEVFHGNFFEDMTEVNKMIDTFPEGYQKDLPLVFQAIVSMIGVNFILGIDFNEMIAIKREMY